ncbi:hypothetical protein N7508_000880 [Penicillium antarcticum]|uniref:uncharacterized protein n=1 Tax=Penicillium antarcticum TaxID=416450 RepID=UPI002394FB3C|nr:uncharacterized protein N7508_000880 [Penicillium antarcticum]KAJ5320597.1 hypothetical protein N7508_000880 [Penicillium antarcticum]
MTEQTNPERHQIHTQHCRFCNHLLLATTRNIPTLPRRSGEGKDKALILPLERTTDENELSAELEAEAQSTNPPTAGAETGAGAGKTRQSANHTTLLLATTIPDRRATMIRREDGIEKRVLLRCGRCRVVIGYYLDEVHYSTSGGGQEGERPQALYLLPGSLVGTEGMGGEGVGEGEWREWIV